MQNYEIKNEQIKRRFNQLKLTNPDQFAQRLNLSWSVWMFGIEKLEDTASRLAKNGIHYIELKADQHTHGSGLKVAEVRKVLGDYDIKVSGACGMFSEGNDLSSTDVYSVQHAVDYIKREVEFLAEVGGEYMIVVPTAVGRPEAADGAEFLRSVNALRSCGDFFAQHGIKAAIEPVRSAEVSLVHSVSDAKRYIGAIGHDAIGHINADTYHMLLEEAHIGEAILSAGDQLVNLHLADSNRDALGSGMIDFDTVIRAAYLIGMNAKGRYVTPEPLGPFPVPYVLANGPCDVAVMDRLVSETASYFNRREQEVLEL